MKVTKKKVYVLTFLFLGGLCLLHPFFNGKLPIISYIHNLVWGNVVDVELSKNLDKSRINVIFKNEFGLIKERNDTDRIAFDKRMSNKIISDTIIKNGVQVADIPYDYGKQVLIVYYKHQEIGRIGHWKTNNWHSHRYYIDISEELGEINMTGEIFGPAKN